MAWNGFPKHIGNKIIKDTINRQPRNACNLRKDDKTSIIYLNLPYLGLKGEQLVKSCLRKLRKCMKQGIDVHFRVLYNTNKISCYTNTKDKTPLLCRSFIVYEFHCPGCKANYIGETERTLFERTLEHGWSNKDKVVYRHLDNCEHFQHLFSLSKFDVFKEIENNYETRHQQNNFMWKCTSEH